MPVSRLRSRSGLCLVLAGTSILALASSAEAWQGRPGVRPGQPTGGTPHRPVLGSTGARPASDQAASPAESDSDWKKLHAAIAEHFAASKDYKAGDLIARGDVARLADALKKLGWVPEDWKDVLEDVLPDGDELVRALRTPRGRNFMRKIAAQPGAYDRLDRLRKLPRGSRQLRELIDTPDGDKLIEYLTTTDGGKALGKQLSQTKGGRGFNEATGRIYTEDDLLKRLEASYRRERGLETSAEPAGGQRPESGGGRPSSTNRPSVPTT